VTTVSAATDKKPLLQHITARNSKKNFKLLNEVMGRSMSEVDGKIRERGGRGVP
jgi:hypothetical protein